MILNIFNGRNQLLQLFIIIAYAALIYFIPVSIADSNGYNPLYDLLINLIRGNGVLIKLLYIIITLSPIIVTHIFLDYLGVIERKNKYFLFIAPLLMFSNKDAWVISPPLVSLILIVIGSTYVLRTTEDDKSMSKLFSATLFFSIASLFYSVAVLNIVLLLIALNIFKQFNFRDALAIIISFTLPYIYLFTYYFVTDSFVENWSYLGTLFNNIGFDVIIFDTPFETAFEVVLISISVFIISTVLVNQRSNLIQVRKYVSFMFLGLLGSIILLLFAGDNTAFHFTIILFLVAIFYTMYFGGKIKVWVYEVFILLFLVHNLFLMWSLFYTN